MADDRFRTDSFPPPPPSVALRHPELPAWLARRLLRKDEKIAWVRSPRFNPWWERYATHPLLFLTALALGAAGLGVGRMIAMSWSRVPPPVFLVTGGLAIGAIIVLGVSAGYFTRLVVTNFRVVVLQGYEVCRSWGIDDLPPFLIRHQMRDGERGRRTVDLEAMQTMLGSSGAFTEAKTILTFVKNLDQIKKREDDRS
jgi:hypothetical protein